MRSITRTPPRVILLFLLPGLVGFVVFLAFPLVMAFAISFTNYSGGPRFRFVGLSNYLRAFSNPDFMNSLGVTARFTLWTVAGQLLLASPSPSSSTRDSAAAASFAACSSCPMSFPRSPWASPSCFSSIPSEGR